MFLTLLAAFFSWLSVSLAISLPESSNWLVPFIWFSFFFIFISLATALIKELSTLTILIVASLGLSFIFTASYWHIPIATLGFLLLLAGVFHIREDLKQNVKINLWKSIRMGRIMIILALSLVIAGQYYFESKKLPPEDLLPKLELKGKTSDILMEKIIPMIAPGFEIENGGDITVDQFILETQKSQAKEGGGLEKQIDKAIEEQFGKNISPEQKELLKQKALEEADGTMKKNEQFILTEGRKQFSEIVGKDLRGDEKVNEVFSEMLNNKINEFLGPKTYSSDGFSFLPVMLAIILFFMALSLGSFISPLWMILAAIIFWILRKAKLVEIKKVPTEKEVIK